MSLNIASLSEEQRWSYLIPSMEKLTDSNKVHREEIRVNTSTVSSLSQQLSNLETRIDVTDRKLLMSEKISRDRNVILFKLKDLESINQNLFNEVIGILSKVGLQIPVVALMTSQKKNAIWDVICCQRPRSQRCGIPS